MKAALSLLLFSVAALANTSLDGTWSLASSAEIEGRGDTISRAGYVASGWMTAQVPTTVMAALVSAKVVSDPNFGINLRETPGVTYPSGYNFSKIDMPPGSPFRVSWWYRRDFPTIAGNKRHWLHLDGINFRANLWLNGRKVADSHQVAGMWRLFDFDVTDLLSHDSDNAIAIEVFPPTPHDLANTFADWNPMPPDKNMGLWRSVYLSESGPVSIRYPQVVSKVSPALDHAQLTVTAELQNSENRPITGELRGAMGARSFAQSFGLAPGERKVIAFPSIEIDQPQLWWPVPMGDPVLHTLKLEALVNGGASDVSETKFGIREITSELVAQGPSIPAGKDGVPLKNLLFKVNGKKILIRGGGYTFDMLLRSSPERQEAELDYVSDMHLNTVRFEGKLEDEHFLDLADRKGILVMAGWTCCDHWEEWKKWNAEDYAIASASLQDQIHRLRNHPSVFVWLNGSDNPPPVEQEKRYVEILKELHWPNPYVSSATSRATQFSGESGVKMLGPYDYVSPAYWLTAHSFGGAYGFNTETGPGPAVPPLATLEKFLPREHLWPIDSWWSFHAGGGPFRTLDVFNKAMDERYGHATNLDDYETRAQLMAYEGERAMFEAFGKNKYVATGVIQWMLNNAWPSVIWHLYDYYLRPGGGYFGAKKACEPLHIQYSYDDASIVVVNSFQQDFPRLTATVEVYNLDMTQQFVGQSVQFYSKADTVGEVMKIPALPHLSDTYFVRLMLNDSNKNTLSRNFYWLPRQPDVLDFPQSTWYLTPTRRFGSLQSLSNLPPATIDSTMVVQSDAGETNALVKIKNTGSSVAFGIDLRLLAENDEVLPVRWEDNYLCLMPGESRTVIASVHTRDCNGKKLSVRMNGWNVSALTIQ